MAAIGCGAESRESDHLILAGDYDLIGREFDSDVLFAGKMPIQEITPNKFTVVRTIDGKKIAGEGRVDRATRDNIPVFRITFLENGKQMIGTFIWRSDLDNHGRLSGYVHPIDYRGAKPGLEALFSAR